jgi:hypothetical protein
MFFNNNSDFINIPRRTNENPRNTPTNNKADDNPGNKSNLNHEFQIDEEDDYPDIIKNNIIENIKITRSGRVIKKPERLQDELKNLMIKEKENHEDYKLIELLYVSIGIGKGFNIQVNSIS